MKKLIAFLLCWPVWAGAATWYVTPTGAGAEDGSDVDNPFAGFADAWATAGDIDAGDTLCVDGTFVGSTDAQISTMMLRILDSGTSGNLITIDGDCDGDGVYATLDGNDEVNIGIAADTGAGQAEYIKVRRLNVTRFIIKGIRGWNNATTDATNDAHQTWEYLRVTDIGDGGTGDNCADMRGNYVEISHTTLDGCDDDAVFHRGTDFRSDYLTTRNFSRTTDTGDGLQISGGNGARYHVSHYDCVDSADAKQCFITSQLTDDGADGIFEDFDLTGSLAAAASNGAYVTGDGAIVRRGRIRGFVDGILLENTANATNMSVSAVMVQDCSGSGIAASASSSTGNQIVNNVVDGCAVGIETRDTDVITIQNNLSMNNSGCGYELEDAGQSESYNASYRNGTAFCLDGVSASAGTGAVTSDPKIAGGDDPATADDFRPVASSPLCNAGIPVSGFEDYTGDQQIKNDIGAFVCGTRVDMTSSNRVDMSASNRVDATSSNMARMQ